jgi:hypothetical protein
MSVLIAPGNASATEGQTLTSDFFISEAWEV